VKKRNQKAQLIGFIGLKRRCLDEKATKRKTKRKVEKNVDAQDEKK